MEISEIFLKSDEKQIRDLTLSLLSIIIRNDCIYIYINILASDLTESLSENSLTDILFGNDDREEIK